MLGAVHFTIRPLLASDVEQIKALHSQWFPVEYPNSWYQDITSNTQRYLTLAAVKESDIIGLIVTELRQSRSCSPDEMALLDKSQAGDSFLSYIMTVGVRPQYRRHGVATSLVKELLIRLQSMQQVKGVYLHVLASNKQAILFYEALSFACCDFIPHYYSIMGHLQNAYCYVLYVNDGHPPPTPIKVILGNIYKLLSFLGTVWIYLYIATRTTLRRYCGRPLRH